MNIHREPAIDDPSRSRVNLGLRRRIWWTAFVSIVSFTTPIRPAKGIRSHAVHIAAYEPLSKGRSTASREASSDFNIVGD